MKILRKYEKLHCKSLKRDALNLNSKEEIKEEQDCSEEFIIKGTYFLDQAEKALLLNRCGIYPIIKNEKLICTSEDDYLNSMKILRKYEKLYYKNLRRKVIELNNKKDINENYNYSHNTTESVITGIDKELKIIKKESGLKAHFYIIANDSSIDNEKIEEREITFNIKEDNPIYNIVGNIYKRNKQENVYLYKNSEDNNYIKITENESGYNFTIVKNRNDKISNNKYALIDIGTITPNNNWYDINKMYTNIKFQSKEKALVKNNRI